MQATGCPALGLLGAGLHCRGWLLSWPPCLLHGWAAGHHQFYSAPTPAGATERACLQGSWAPLGLCPLPPQIVFARAYTFDQQFEFLPPLVAKMAEEPFKLLICDSLTNNMRWVGGGLLTLCAACRLLPALQPLAIEHLHSRPPARPPARCRTEYQGRGELAERQQRLGALMAKLRKVRGAS